MNEAILAKQQTVEVQVEAERRQLVWHILLSFGAIAGVVAAATTCCDSIPAISVRPWAVGSKEDCHCVMPRLHLRHPATSGLWRCECRLSASTSHIVIARRWWTNVQRPEFGNKPVESCLSAVRWKYRSPNDLCVVERDIQVRVWETLETVAADLDASGSSKQKISLPALTEQKW